MMAYQAWQSWSRKGLQSNADLWMIAARTHRQMAECHGQAVHTLIRNWPEFGAWQPQVLPKVMAGLVEGQIHYQDQLRDILQRGGQALAATAWGLMVVDRSAAAGAEAG